MVGSNNSYLTWSAYADEMWSNVGGIVPEEFNLYLMFVQLKLFLSPVYTLKDSMEVSKCSSNIVFE